VLHIFFSFFLKPDKVEKIIIEDVSPKEPEPEVYYIYEAMVEEFIKCFSESTASDSDGTMNRKLRECIYRTVPVSSNFSSILYRSYHEMSRSVFTHYSLFTHSQLKIFSDFC